MEEDDQARGFELKQVATGYRLQVKQEFSTWVGRLWEEKPARYTRALLETMALIAYRQPITRGEIEEVRGVSVSSNIIKTLLERDWIKVLGHKDVPGKPTLYGTTKEFLDYFNLKKLDELPTLAEIKDLDSINPELEFDEGEKDGSNEDDSTGGGDDNTATGTAADEPVAAEAADTALEQEAAEDAEGAAGTEGKALDTVAEGADDETAEDEDAAAVRSAFHV